ncbi:GNAT family N-acetyltransferase [uncultured Reyranella sp.]|uniref:GNAT family N-acetyltransferase n=1 Tax=uncultured Reyranella sp. TaxID=735512 RepID=UPI0025F0DBD0|nr:GNAT family N-acetyltransferase [uncultured Reyranella sp.]
MSFIFRIAQPSECADADRVLRAAFTPYLAKLGREMPPDYYKWLPASIERGDVFVAAEDGRVVGVAATERRESELFLDRLAVDPSNQGTGLGRWLLRRLDEVARERGDCTVSLITAEMMDHLIRLYRSHGFEIIHRGPPDHGKDAHIRVHMVKRL